LPGCFANLSHANLVVRWKELKDKSSTLALTDQKATILINQAAKAAKGEEWV